MGFPHGASGKEPACQCILRWKEPLEEEVTTHSSILAWRIPWTEEPGGLQSMESQRVIHNRTNSMHAQIFKILTNFNSKSPNKFAEVFMYLEMDSSHY